MADPLSQLQIQIATQACWDEQDCVKHLLKICSLSKELRATASQDAERLIELARSQRQHRDVLDAFLEEFGLNTSEGVALMCLAEALLRIPDGESQDELIQEKMLQGDWQKHLGNSESLFVNASTWGLLLTGKWFALEDKIRRDSATWLSKLVENLGEPVVRQCMLQAMRIMGKQYILGQTIGDALQRAPKEYGKKALYSFDALGEGARTQAAADQHLQDYIAVIKALAQAPAKDGITAANSVSIKLSALHPRYQFSQQKRVMKELLPRVIELCLLAKAANIGLSIDAEEAERLDIELVIFRELALHHQLSDWPGLGFVLQAYQKRAITTVDWLIQLSKQRRAPLSVRLVKGAYWDREIKRGQQLGLADYPVFTRKVNTDLSYLVCAEKLLAAGSERIYPQFASHNALTLATVCAMARGKPFELQRLHGMGDLLYDNLGALGEELLQVRIYAPIGGHKDLLPYLVRRLLENGANSSFVNRFLDATVPAKDLSTDIVSAIEQSKIYRHPAIPKPALLYLDRPNSSGLDLENPAVTELWGGKSESSVVQAVHESDAQAMELALASCAAYQDEWNLVPAAKRALLLEAVAQLLEQKKTSLMSLIAQEAGRTLVDSESEVREAVDFCYYYALQTRTHFAEVEKLPGPVGEDNSLALQGRGVFLCISPWNFPLAIFVGQIAAALAAGNCVIAKPAEQTPRIAQLVVSLFYRAGFPRPSLQLVTGDGPTTGRVLVSDSRIQGIAFTGSTDTAQLINRQLAKRNGPLVPLIAETGGINCMLVDSTALLEQVVDDVVRSAFSSAGQRCSALRLLIIQDSIADEFLNMLTGACQQLCLGNPLAIDTDIGPLIDSDAKKMVEKYITQQQSEWPLLYSYPANRLPQHGNFVGPHIFEVPNVAAVDREIFGPVLHVLRFKRSAARQLIADINHCGYGLTFAIHSRIESWANEMARSIKAGNVYINRNMIGAVVGVQPFGGMGLSGTGPKAGGPHYLQRFATEKTLTNNSVATGGNAALLSLAE